MFFASPREGHLEFQLVHEGWSRGQVEVCRRWRGGDGGWCAGGLGGDRIGI